MSKEFLVLLDIFKENNSIHFKIEESSIIYTPLDKNGFEISLEKFNDEFIVYYLGWHEHFATINEAIFCFLFGLTEECRVQEYSRGESSYKWIAEASNLENDNKWQSISTTSLLIFPFWQKKVIRTFQNSIFNTYSEISKLYRDKLFQITDETSLK